MAASSVWGPNPWGSGGNANWWMPPGSVEAGEFERAPDTGYMRFLLGTGRGGGQSNADQWYQQQFGRLHDTYIATLPEQQNPSSYRWMDFLRDYGGQLDNQYAGLSANQRGERNNFHRLRWIL
jgi:hypothetical protein